ncbi:uncharacterized protein LOC133293700 [Gastrolobium bilobum]|uniref:uncharacterized protein LOC133293700 n=1 Tax=Gastrolobium bilobum TaxID=150636 RepID=UPI002AB0A005|nr:uncharacterized protein LOC133293700 [Gastrolobium bilobum]
MNTYTFRVLCSLVRVEGMLKEDGLVSIEEQVAMFLHILAHHAKNRVIKFKFQRSGETVSRYFNLVLKSVLRLQENLLKVPDPVPENCTDDRWKWFKGCLGALDGTYITVNVPEADKPRCRSRKGEIATNVLGVCSRDMKFVYVLPGWEGSASDARVLRDAINRRNGLKVPTGKNMLKLEMREMDTNPLEIELGNISIDEEVDEELHDSIDTIDTSEAWSAWRDALANEMYNDWVAH